MGQKLKIAGWVAIGAVAGMMVAPVVFLDPNMMTGVLIYAFAGALIGGIYANRKLDVYADWVLEITDDWPVLRAYRQRLLKRPSFARCWHWRPAGTCWAGRRTSSTGAPPISSSPTMTAGSPSIA